MCRGNAVRSRSLHGSGPIAPATSASATNVAVNVLVAGIASSPPAERSMITSATSPSGLGVSFTIATVRAPVARIRSRTLTTSGVRPDWLMPTAR